MNVTTANSTVDWMGCAIFATICSKLHIKIKVILIKLFNYCMFYIPIMTFETLIVV